MSEEHPPAGDPPENPSDPPVSPPAPSPSTPPVPPPAAKPVETPWYKARIDELTAKLHRANEEVAQARQSSAQAPPVAATPSNAPPAFDQAAFDRAVSAEAQRRTIMDQFSARCDGCVTRGRELFGVTEFDAQVRNLRKLVDDKDTDSTARYNGLLNAAFETGADAEIVNELGGDLDRAMRLLSMPPMKMAVELERMASTLRSSEPPNRARGADGRFLPESTNAPPPIRPVGSRGAQHTPIAPDDPDRSDSLSTEEFMRRRTEQIAARQRNGVAIQ